MVGRLLSFRTARFSRGELLVYAYSEGVFRNQKKFGVSELTHFPMEHYLEPQGSWRTRYPAFKKPLLKPGLVVMVNLNSEVQK